MNFQTFIQILYFNMNITQPVNLDNHLALRLIAKIQSKGPIDVNLKFRKISLLSKTRRFDELEREVDSIKEIGFPTLKQRLAAARIQTDQQINALGGESLLKELEAIEDRSDSYDKKTEELFTKSYKLARIYYEMARYEDAWDLLAQLDFLVESDALWIPISWGRLHCEILLNKVEAAKDSAKRLKYKIQDYRFKNTERALTQKQAFLNTCCFVFFEAGRQEDYETFINICSGEEYFSTIQMACPYVFRYLCCAMILNKNCQKYGDFDLYRLIDSINRNLFKYNDSVVEFLRNLLIKFDFDLTTQSLDKLKTQISADYFLSHLRQKLQQNCHFLYYETYCKIHQTLNISAVNQLLNRSQDQAELWIINLIRRAQIPAKIDSVAGVIHLSKNFTRNTSESKYAQLIPRTNTIVSNLSRILSQN